MRGFVYTNLLSRLKRHYQEYPDISCDQRVYTTPLQRYREARAAGAKPTLFVFAYDWRQSSVESARELKQYID